VPKRTCVGRISAIGDITIEKRLELREEALRQWAVGPIKPTAWLIDCRQAIWGKGMGMSPPDDPRLCGPTALLVNPDQVLLFARMCRGAAEHGILMRAFTIYEEAEAWTSMRARRWRYQPRLELRAWQVSTPAAL
jgi:hypothetical protein